MGEKTSQRIRTKGNKNRQFNPKETSIPMTTNLEPKGHDQREQHYNFVPIISITEISESTTNEKVLKDIEYGNKISKEPLEKQNLIEKDSIKSKSDDSIIVTETIVKETYKDKENQNLNLNKTVTLSKEIERTTKDIEPAPEMMETSGDTVQPPRVQEEERMDHSVNDDVNEGVRT
ncbi:hypothetical protein EAI_05482 [Harpegnathos saltator]|uniref:Uncharacterized protein n=1 Tax=Harpegnathos saltator TaxID=610380 RepID=E2BCX4_HARSA|nr:hypothetical protein EAI_05482 [Harpegnathos saltator]